MREKVPKSNEIYEALCQRIVRLEYLPGQVLKEADIADEFRVSRTVVRNAFEQLKNKNLLNNIPRFGAQVMPLDLQYMKSVFEAVRETEGFAARLAAQRMPAEEIVKLQEIVARIKGYNPQVDHRQMLRDDACFHEIVIRGCENPCVIQQLLDLHLHTERFWHLYHKSLSDRRLFYETLAGLAEAIRDRDADKAEKWAKEHVDAFVQTIRQVLL